MVGFRADRYYQPLKLIIMKKNMYYDRLPKLNINPEGAAKKTATQNEKTYREAKLRSLSDSYSEVYCYVIFDDGDMVNLGIKTINDSEDFDERSFAGESASLIKTAKPVVAIIQYIHKIYTVCQLKRTKIMDSRHWEYKRSIVQF
jgi:hypothetical protein